MWKKALRRAIGPLAATAFPVFSLYSSNLDWVTFGRIVFPLCLLLAAALILFAFCAGMFRSIEKGCFVATCFVPLLFAYGLIVPFKLDAFSMSLLVVYQALFFLFGLLSIYVFLSRRSFSIAADVVTLVAVTVLCVPILQVVWFEFVQATTEATTVTLSDHPRTAPAITGMIKPDIYHIILDGYARDDVLKELYGIDNTPFLEALQQRGFYVASESRSNYLQTMLSLTSTLNMTYLDRLKGPTYSGEMYRRRLQRCITRGAVLSELRAYGYTYVRFVSALGNLNLEAGADVELSPVAGILDTTQIQLLDGLLRGSPWRHNLMMRGWLMNSSQPLVLFQFQNLKKFKPQPNRPQFVFTHILCPHPPFVFDRNGHIAPDASANLSDGSDFPGTREEYRKGYTEQLLYVNTEVLRTVDAILENYSHSQRPVIIIQGDHGSGSRYNQESAEGSLLWERSSILNAYLVPDSVRPALYKSITPVNTYRVLFNGLFKRDFNMLDDRTFFASYRRPYEQKPISEDKLAPNYKK